MTDNERQPASRPCLIADRVRNIRQTALRRISARCAEVGGINLSQGVCDLPAPEAVKAAASKAIDDDHAIYTNLAGVAKLRRAIAEKMRSFNGIDIDPQTQLAVTVGAAGAFACVVNATLNPGDQVVVFSPFYNYYVDVLTLVGASIRFVHTRPPVWAYDDRALATAFTDRTRMVLINTPANPTGKVFTPDELAQIAALAERHHALIVTDEVYEYITYETPHTSIAALPQAAGRTLTMSSGSKTYAVTGWRVGYVAGPAEIIEKILVVSDLYYICAPAPLQHGLLAGLALPPAYYDELRADYRAKRDMLADALRDVAFQPFVPQGAFYMMADFGAGRWPNAIAAAESILESVGVASVPGAPFYADPVEGETQLRFCFAKRTADLEEACRRLRHLAR